MWGWTKQTYLLFLYIVLFLADVQQLMACLLYSRTGIENSPYASLLDPVHWLDICDIFARDACALLGLSLESPLQVCITAGCVALPSLLQIRQVMQQRQVTGVWTSKDELPVSQVCFLRTTFVSVTELGGPCGPPRRVDANSCCSLNIPLTFSPKRGSERLSY